MAFRRDFITVNYAAIIVPRGRVCGTACPRPSSSLGSDPAWSGDRGALEMERGCDINLGQSSSLYDDTVCRLIGPHRARVFFVDKNRKRYAYLQLNVVLHHKSSSPFLVIPNSYN